LRAITDAAGAKVESATYKPFCEQTEFVTPGLAAPESKGWIGERYDADAGLQYLNARYYDPSLGMFLQPDWFEVLRPGVGTNRFSYSFNDPVNLSDPRGNAAVYKDGHYVGQINPRDPGYASVTGNRKYGDPLPSEWVRANSSDSMANQRVSVSLQQTSGGFLYGLGLGSAIWGPYATQEQLLSSDLPDPLKAIFGSNRFYDLARMAWKNSFPRGVSTVDGSTPVLEQGGWLVRGPTGEIEYVNFAGPFRRDEIVTGPKPDQAIGMFHTHPDEGLYRPYDPSSPDLSTGDLYQLPGAVVRGSFGDDISVSVYAHGSITLGP
jgi:RHS repeat-associated protein